MNINETLNCVGSDILSKSLQSKLFALVYLKLNKHDPKTSGTFLDEGDGGSDTETFNQSSAAVMIATKSVHSITFMTH